MSRVDKRLVEAGARWRQNPAAMVRELFGVEPDLWQIDVLECFPTSPLLAMKACKGPGKLQPKSMMLDTPDGPRRWGDLRVGDRLFAEDGSPTRIKAVYDNGVVPLFRVIFDDGSSTLAGAEHLWKVRGHRERERRRVRGKTTEEWIVINTAEIIQRGVRSSNGKWQQRQFEIPRHGPAQIAHAELPLDPYVLGVWLGDGSKNSGQFTGVDSDVDAEIVRRGYEIGNKRDGKTATIYGISGALRSLGVLILGSHERYVPQAFKYSSIQQRTDLLMGLMDTDGCVATDGHCEFGSTSRALVDDVAWLVRSLGGCATVKAKVKRGRYKDSAGDIVECRDFYRLTVTVPFAPFKASRKSVRWKPKDNKSSDRYMTRYIDRIEPAAAEDSMCVEIDHTSRCYLANDFIVTHNTTVLAWLAWNFLLTRHNPNIAATSISGDNLKDGLLKEMSKWYAKCPLLQAAFTITNTRIFAKQAEKNWWLSFRTWPKSGDTQSQADTLAGLHEDNVMFILDEAGGIPPAVLVTAEAALSSCVEGHVLMAGNPTSLDGALYAAEKESTERGGKWRTFSITGDPEDPKRAPRVKEEWARDQIRKYGRDNPWVLVNVFGQFPPTSLNTLISEDEVREAMRRMYREWDLGHQPKIIGVDVARQGDDASVLARRRGLQMYPFKKYRNLTGIEGASIANRLWNEFGADAMFVDGTGGFGYTWIDQLSTLGRTAIPVGFADEARDSVRYYNRRAEMALEFVEAIKNGLALPPEGTEGMHELKEALIHTTYTFKGDRLLLEPKEDVKSKIGFSPDEMDAAMLTYAEPVTAARKQPGAVNYSAVSTYNPHAEMDRIMGTGYNVVGNYNPFGGN
jgi:hypothetical protein